MRSIKGRSEFLYLEDTAILDGLAEVPPRGQAFTVWVPEDVVEEAK